MTLSLRYRPSAYLSASFPRSTAGIQACRNHRLSPLTRLRRPGSGTASSSAKRGRPNKNQPSGARRAEDGGAGRDRTDDLKLAKLPLSQLSYGPDLPALARLVCVQAPRRLRSRLVASPREPDRSARPRRHSFFGLSRFALLEAVSRRLSPRWKLPPKPRSSRPKAGSANKERPAGARRAEAGGPG